MKRFFLLLMMLSLLRSCLAQAEGDFDLTFTDRELEGTWKEKNAVTIIGSGSTCEIAGKGAALEDGTLKITRAGVYVLSGEFTDILIHVKVGKTDKVQLVLLSARIESSVGPAIYVRQADKVFITVPEGEDTLISDGISYDITDDDKTLDASIYSRADLCLNGQGKLQVAGNYKHGVLSKDDLVITGLTLTVNAVSTALDGKDCVMMYDVSADITAGSNGIRSDNNEEADRGFVYIQNSTLVVTAGSDGIQAETLLRADNAVMTITTGGGSSAASKSSGNEFGSGGSGGGSGGERSSTSESTGSWKGLKSAADMQINGGAFTLDTADDCIHTNGNLAITDGIFRLSSGDDGVHADNELHISGGDFIISKSYEGLEASKLYISGGTFDITASDDGLNAAGGADGSASADRWGRGFFSNGVGEIYISGGYVHINADGDGIDSNKNIAVSGGVTLVSGSPSSMNAAFDYDGEATVTGGVLIAVGGSGMAQSFTGAENQCCMLFNYNGGKAGVNLAIVDADGQVVVAYTPENNYSSVVVTAPGLQLGNTYTIVGNAQIDSMDEHGFATNAACTGGTTLGSIQIKTELQGGSGHSFGGPGGR